MVHFFLYDYKFDRVWKNPDTDLEKLKRYRAILTPDFSMYTEMAPIMQLYNTFRNRWYGAYYASKGIRVIPSVSWGDENTFTFCFWGIEKGSTVAVSTYMVSEHNHHKDQKKFFLRGYNEMLRRVEPERIICYNEPFPEMQGNIVYVDYELSSWRYMNDDLYVPSKYARYICGEEPLPSNSGIVIKAGWITPDDSIAKGMGSAYGGKWQPKNPDDKRLLGKPSEVKKTRAEGKRGGYDRDTKIGEDGKAERERHYTDHSNPKLHTNPHDHMISWDTPKPGVPNFGEQINYPDGKVPDFDKDIGAGTTIDDPYGTEAESKCYKGMNVMSNIFETSSMEDKRFETISDFEDCMIRGGEVEFSYGERTFGVFPLQRRTPESSQQILIVEKFIENQEETEQWYDTADKALEHMIDGVRLRDIITEVEVSDRTI